MGEIIAEPNGGRADAYAAMERDIDLFADLDFEEAAAITPTITEESNNNNSSFLISSQDADRGVKMKRGQGHCGMGSAIHLEAGVEKRPFHDVAGFCSPGRWMPHKRLADPVSIKLFQEVRNLLASYFPDLPVGPLARKQCQRTGLNTCVYLCVVLLQFRRPTAACLR